jgi:hypothetical protein
MCFALSPEVAASLRARGVMKDNPPLPVVASRPDGKRTWESLDGLTPEEKAARKSLQRKMYGINVGNN